MSMAQESVNECRPKLEELFCNFSPDAAVVFMMLVILMEYLVEKGFLKKDEVAEISTKAYELMAEVGRSMA
jgi:hypothetical protein